MSPLKYYVMNYALECIVFKHPKRYALCIETQALRLVILVFYTTTTHFSVYNRKYNMLLLCIVLRHNHNNLSPKYNSFLHHSFSKPLFLQWFHDFFLLCNYTVITRTMDNSFALQSVIPEKYPLSR